MIQWQDLHHSDLTVHSLYALLKLRCEVFVVEQTCPYQDIDGDDLVGENRHILGWRNNELVAYARILKSEDDFEPVVIGRVIISGKARGEKLGYQLMEKTLEACQKQWPNKALYGRAGAPAVLLRPLWFRAGHRSIRRRRHSPHRHGAGSEAGVMASRWL